MRKMAFRDTYQTSLDETLNSSDYTSSDTNPIYNTMDMKGTYRKSSKDVKPRDLPMYRPKGPVVIYDGMQPYAKENGIARILMKKTDHPGLQPDNYAGRVK